MLNLKSVVMRNIQSHVNTVLEFPQTGVVRFYGNNNHGKSVLVRALSDIITNGISRPYKRLSIIRRGQDFGEVLLTRYDGTTLLVHIEREAANTYAELTRPQEQAIRRYLADKSIPLLVNEFGWHYNADVGVSLNLHEDDDKFLFTNTKKSTNFALINGTRSDPFAEAAMESVTQLLKDTKKYRQDVTHMLEVSQATYTALQTWDVEKEAEVQKDCMRLAQVLTKLNVPPMPILPAIATATFYQMVEPMPTFKYPKIYSVCVEGFPEGNSILRDYMELKERRCPVCGRKFVEGIV